MEGTLVINVNLGEITENKFTFYYSISRESFAEKNEYKPWIKHTYVLKEENMSYHSIQVILSDISEKFTPRTPLGRKLLALRNKAIEKGMNLLSADEILEEIRRRRGELDSDEENVY